MIRHIASMLLMALAFTLGMAVYGFSVYSYCSSWIAFTPDALTVCWNDWHPFAFAAACVPALGLFFLAIVATMSEEEEEEDFNG